MHKNEFQFKNTGSIIPIYRKSNKRERKPMKYYIKFIGFTLFEKETYLLRDGCKTFCRVLGSHVKAMEFCFKRSSN